MLANAVHVRPDKDIFGRSVSRSMREYPYSFDPTVVWKGSNFQQTTDRVDSDRLMNWDNEKFKTCCMKIWGNDGQLFWNRSPDSIQEFLRLYLDVQILLSGIEVTCNAHNGYPYWTFYFVNPRK